MRRGGCITLTPSVPLSKGVSQPVYDESGGAGNPSESVPSSGGVRVHWFTLSACLRSQKRNYR